MTVYRVQDSEGRGPFKPGFSKYWIDGDSDRELLNPWFEEVRVEDVWAKLRNGERAGCACESMDDLLAWFLPLELERLQRMGYSVIEFEPKRVLFRLPQSKQCIVVLPERKTKCTTETDVKQRMATS